MRKNSKKKTIQKDSNECYIYLCYKIDEQKNMIDDMGLMTMEEFRKDVFMNKFTLNETEKAVFKAIKEGKVDCYYQIVCDNCHEEQLAEEEDLSVHKTEMDLRKGGFECVHCNYKSKVDLPMQKKYCFSNNILSEQESETRTLFDKIKGLFPWMKK